MHDPQSVNVQEASALLQMSPLCQGRIACSTDILLLNALLKAFEVQVWYVDAGSIHRLGSTENALTRMMSSTD